MKVKILTILVVLTVSISCITACTTKSDYLVKVMKLTPKDTDMVLCMDIEAMAAAPDFSACTAEDSSWQFRTGHEFEQMARVHSRRL